MFKTSKPYDTLIIGAGPAGVQAAQSLAAFGLRVLIIEKNSCAGGLQINNPYINHWLACAHNQRGEDFVEAMNLNLTRPNVSFHTSVRNLSFSVSEEEEFSIIGDSAEGAFAGSAKTVILATGVRPRSAGFTPSERFLIGPGNQIENGKFQDQKIAVLGGGDNAFENYVFLKEKGAKDVKLFTRSLRARVNMIAPVPKDKIFLGDYHVNPEKLTVNAEKFDRICVFYGWEANVPFNDVLQLSSDPKGYIRVDGFYETSRSNVYAVGEIASRTHPSFVTAMAEGMIAAKRIQEISDRPALERLERELRCAETETESLLVTAKRLLKFSDRKIL